MLPGLCLPKDLMEVRISVFASHPRINEDLSSEHALGVLDAAQKSVRNLGTLRFVLAKPSLHQKLPKVVVFTRSCPVAQMAKVVNRSSWALSCALLSKCAACVEIPCQILLAGSPRPCSLYQYFT